MKVQVLLFGPVAEAFRSPQIELEVEEATTVADLQAALRRLRPDLDLILAGCRWAQNQRFVSLDTPVAPTDELAVIPPVAGG